MVARKSPMIGSFTGCCARAASGHTAAAPLSSMMNSRRFIACPCMPNSAFNSRYQNRKVSQAKLVGGAAGRALYSMTSSAIASTPGGMVRLSDLVVLRLITSSNLLGSSTGRSEGLSPLRIRPTYTPTC